MSAIICLRLFVIFDVEVVFSYPWVAGYDVLRSEVGAVHSGGNGFVCFLLILGLLYAWKKKVLEWE